MFKYVGLSKITNSSSRAYIYIDSTFSDELCNRNKEKPLFLFCFLKRVCSTGTKAQSLTRKARLRRKRALLLMSPKFWGRLPSVYGHLLLKNKEGKKVYCRVPWLLIFLGNQLPSFYFIASSEWKMEQALLQLSIAHLLSWRHSAYSVLICVTWALRHEAPLGISAHGASPKALCRLRIQHTLFIAHAPVYHWVCRIQVQGKLKFSGWL